MDFNGHQLIAGSWMKTSPFFVMFLPLVLLRVILLLLRVILLIVVSLVVSL